MLEPILSLGIQQDCLDLMQEMKLQEMLENPIIVEVTNFINEGKFSTPTSPFAISQTYSALVNFSAFSNRNIGDRLILNIKTFGKGSDQKIQSSIMFNIWKHSVLQRQNDEVLLTILFSVALLVQTLFVNENFSESSALDEKYLGGRDIFTNQDLIQNLTPENQRQYC